MAGNGQLRFQTKERDNVIKAVNLGTRTGESPVIPWCFIMHLSLWASFLIISVYFVLFLFM